MDFHLGEIARWMCCAFGGAIGYVVALFEPAFPMAAVVVALILYDAWTAYELDGRVHKMYPDRKKEDRPYFTSFAFGKVVRKTIPDRMILILLAYSIEHWVLQGYLPLAMIVSGIICFEQTLSILENKSSCRTDEESKIWKTLQRILIDKTARHFDIDIDECIGKDEDQDDDTL